MSAIRPDLPTVTPNAASAPTAGMRAAQAAFFRAAMAGVEGAPPAPPKTGAATSEPAAEPPRLPRPGQLLDIRV